MNIMLVDDEQLSLLDLEEAVQKALPGEVPRCFSDVREALFYAKEHPVDVAFLDIDMGEVSGLDLARALKKLRPAVNIIFVTGYMQYMNEAFRLYASGYVKKPARAGRIKREIANLRNKLPDGAVKPPDGVGAFVFDHTMQRVYRDGTDLMLKPMEYRIFLVLASNPGVFFMPQELYEKASGTETGDDLRSLYVHMSNLRKNLGLYDFGKKNVDIEHKRGKGYRLIICSGDLR